MGARQDFTAVRDFLTQEMREMDLPWEPLPTQSGYFLLTDVSKCRDLIPDHYFRTHDYEPKDSEFSSKPPVRRVHLHMPTTNEIPMDLAFCRWMAIQNRITM